MCIILSLILSSLENDKKKQVNYDYLDENEQELVKGVIMILLILKKKN